MFKAILLDLDDTLLSCSMDIFFPAYIGYLTRYVAHMIPPEVFVSELTRATQAMDANDGTGATNEATFAASFYPAVGYEPDELVPLFERFYAEEF
ncbi:MAG: HAD family hydrolase, partial [Candidatus Omnitrophica bacterium]|nr:HAD family hydrolase [Candidatus Omnitrophota bacterium]